MAGSIENLDQNVKLAYPAPRRQHPLVTDTPPLPEVRPMKSSRRNKTATVQDLVNRSEVYEAIYLILNREYHPSADEFEAVVGLIVGEDIKDADYHILELRERLEGIDQTLLAWFDQMVDTTWTQAVIKLCTSPTETQPSA